MKLKSLSLRNYRNYENLDITLSSGLNIFIGNNAQGKSNILESIFVLAFTKSYINVKDQYLIKDEREFSVIKSKFYTEHLENNFEVIISKNYKKLKINGLEINKYSDYVSRVKVLIFSPYNVNFVKDGPNVRRKNINMVISQLSNNYLKILQSYNALLKKRNLILKTNNFFNESTKIYFDMLNDQFCSMAIEIIYQRRNYIENVSRFLEKIYFEVTGYNGLKLIYNCNMDIFNSRLDSSKYFKTKINLLFDRELKYGMTLLGPHRDDFSFFLDDKPLEIYGSQGQIRAAILALKLSELMLFKEKEGDYPILLLDDIFSELDIEKRNRILKYILDDVQTIITTTDINLIDKSLLDRSKIFIIENGKVIENGKKECNDE